MQMVGAYSTGSNYSETTIVKKVKGSAVNTTAITGEVMEYIPQIWGIRASVNTALTFDVCQAHINNRRPFIMFIRWNSGDGHMVVCDGYQASQKGLRVIDPWSNSKTTYYTYSAVISNCTFQSGTGKWNSTVELI